VKINIFVETGRNRYM